MRIFTKKIPAYRCGVYKLLAGTFSNSIPHINTIVNSKNYSKISYNSTSNRAVTPLLEQRDRCSHSIF